MLARRNQAPLFVCVCWCFGRDGFYARGGVVLRWCFKFWCILQNSFAEWFSLYIVIIITDHPQSYAHWNYKNNAKPCPKNFENPPKTQRWSFYTSQKKFWFKNFIHFSRTSHKFSPTAFTGLPFYRVVQVNAVCWCRGWMGVRWALKIDCLGWCRWIISVCLPPDVEGGWKFDGVSVWGSQKMKQMNNFAVMRQNILLHDPLDCCWSLCTDGGAKISWPELFIFNKNKIDMILILLVHSFLFIRTIL